MIYRIESIAVLGTSQIDKKADEKREAGMMLILVAIGIAIACFMVFLSVKRGRNRSELEQHSLSAEQLESLMASGLKVYLFDVRQPLDLLAYPEHPWCKADFARRSAENTLAPSSR